MTTYLENLPPSGLAYFLALHHAKDRVCIVVPDEIRAQQVAQDLPTFGLRDLETVVGNNHVPYEEVSPDPLGVAHRFSLRRRFLLETPPQILVFTASSLMQRWMSDSVFMEACEIWGERDNIDRDIIVNQLLYCGYQPVNTVEDEGTYAVRGGIVDIFPPDRAQPIRLDMFGDEISSIRSFDPVTQRTFDTVSHICIYPIRDVLFNTMSIANAVKQLELYAEHSNIPTRRLSHLRESIQQRHYVYGIEAIWPVFYKESGTLLSNIQQHDYRFVIDHVSEVEQIWENFWKKAEDEYYQCQAQHRFALKVDTLMVEPETLRQEVITSAEVISSPLFTEAVPDRVDLPLRSFFKMAQAIKQRKEIVVQGNILDPLVQEIKTHSFERRDVFLACATRGRAERLRELLRGHELDLPIYSEILPLSEWGRPKRTPTIAIFVATLTCGFCDLHRGFAIISDHEVFGTPSPSMVSRRSRGTPKDLATLKRLDINDLVIHVDHGVGCYRGLLRLVIQGLDGDYLHIEYADGDRLYLPIFKCNLVQKYTESSRGVRLDKLGSQRWLKTKQRVKDAVLVLAHELLAIQARRQSFPGLAFGIPDDHFRAFEAAFPFETTEDQQRAIEEVIHDLNQSRPMDRLICGDVGFGKTEVAIRAAFLTVLTGKQVVILVPTTVLAEQHGATFRERMSKEAVSVAVINRFRTRKETQQILEKLRLGSIDILIGTHRLLSGDVHFKDLGLLVIDEEQRFGVKQKERIKQLRSQVHVLALSATPIPRTLHMAMTQLKSISIISTPPAERVAIRTEVLRFDEKVIQESVQRELRRGGQVFVVHNRVQSITSMANIVHRLVPKARIAIAHGQMPNTELEKIMVAFVRKAYDVLVCTAIIESGIDIPTVNTMIVNRADRFGLSQLYQLRGRIGRSQERGFAYLFLPRSDRIHREAVERLAILKRHTDLGSGFQIASYDLEMRGAGDLLGRNQSGHIEAVGYQLYTELLQRAIERTAGQHRSQQVEPEIKLPIISVIPENYVPEPTLRLSFYQRMALSPSLEKLMDIFDEMEDRFGTAPEEVHDLVTTLVIRRRLKEIGVSQISASWRKQTVSITLSFVPDPPIVISAVIKKAENYPQQYRLSPTGRLSIVKNIDTVIDKEKFLDLVQQELRAIPLREFQSTGGV